MFGGYPGGQAEYVRVPFADVNCLKVPDALPDEKALFLSDIACTGWHANELARVSAGQIVAVWGCGPVGLMALAWAKHRGAKRIIAIDNEQYRLDFAKTRLDAEIINGNDVDVVKTLREMVPGGPDAGIDCTGFRFPKTLAHKLQQTLRLEADALDVITEMVKAVRKSGHLAIIGEYFGTGNLFPIGAVMQKGLIISGGQVNVQKYWKELLAKIEKGEFDPTFVVSHRFKLEDADKAYRIFARHEDKVIKVLLLP